MRPLLGFSRIAVRTGLLQYDGERAIDDFILLSFLCGNDFVPALPTLDIGEGALDTLLAVCGVRIAGARCSDRESQTYRESLESLGGYLTDRGTIDFARLEVRERALLCAAGLCRVT